MDVRCFTVGQVAENCYVVRRDGADRGLIVDPGEEPERILGGRRRARDRDRRDPRDPHALRPHRRRRPGGGGDRGTRLLPRDRGPGARRHHVLRPLARVRPVRELRRRRDGRRRRAARARRARDRGHLHARATAPGTSRTRSATSRRCSPATCCSRARSAGSTSRAATGRPCWRASGRWSTAIGEETVVYPGSHGGDDARRRARLEPVPGRAHRLSATRARSEHGGRAAGCRRAACRPPGRGPRR